jgi:hypothetical protein
MPKATIIGGALKPINDCYIIIPIDIPESQLSELPPAVSGRIQNKEYKIVLDNLPEISDTKSANYSDEVVIGRASPLKTYSQSDNRSISMQLHFIISKPEDVDINLLNLRAIQSATYPREGEGEGTNRSPFFPPPVCRIKCGKLLSNAGELCVILKSYSVKFLTEVSWFSSSEDGFGDSFTPMKFDIDTTWDVVYSSSDLPGQQRIFTLGA